MPAALIEEMSAPLGQFQAMDYVTAGTVLTVGTGRRLVLDYLASCTRETVTGGTVTIGQQQSIIMGGQVDRVQVPCAGTTLQLAAYQADVGGVATMRGFGAGLMTIGATSPALLLSARDPVVIESLDPPRPPITLRNGAIRASNAADHGPHYLLDLAGENIRLAPGALYRARQGSRHVDFRIATAAGDGRLPLIGRLLPL